MVKCIQYLNNNLRGGEQGYTGNPEMNNKKQLFVLLKKITERGELRSPKYPSIDG